MLLGAFMIIAVIIVIYNVVSISVLDASIAQAIGSLLSALVAIGVSYFGVKEYDKHIKDKKADMLCQYSQRYATDMNIKKVVDWMLRNMNDNGSLKVSDHRTTEGEPNVFEKEMFMRFFEELYAQMKRGYLRDDDVKKMFSYYALKFNDYKFFRNSITDYLDKDTWNDFHQFIIKMGGRISTE